MEIKSQTKWIYISKKWIPTFLYHPRVLPKTEWYDNIWAERSIPDIPTIESFCFSFPRLLVTGTV